MAHRPIPSYVRHHLVPRSRASLDGTNLAVLPRRLEAEWHAVFANATPEEVLQQLLDEWLPPGSVQWVEYRRTFDPQRLKPCPRSIDRPRAERYRRLFPQRKALAVIKDWYLRWVPPQYFTYLRVCRRGQVTILRRELLQLRREKRTLPRRQSPGRIRW
ncbi:MAG: hypothetical protein HYY50_00200 [Candidatus Kerfeldbacteria bacterium]|nr:hypothetical protein [Candidatus Kerfeldbacteria bacterium]